MSAFRRDTARAALRFWKGGPAGCGDADGRSHFGDGEEAQLPYDGRMGADDGRIGACARHDGRMGAEDTTTEAFPQRCVGLRRYTGAGLRRCRAGASAGPRSGAKAW